MVLYEFMWVSEVRCPMLINYDRKSSVSVSLEITCTTYLCLL